MNLKEELMAYIPWNDQEEQDRLHFLEYLETQSHLYTRENEEMHITSSPWIINKENTKVLMVHHNIYHSWGWCGGHADGDEDLLHVAIKEGREETGIPSLLPYQTSIFAIDILPVPAHLKHGKQVKEHLHINVTYLCIADENDVLHIRPDENSGVKWTDKNEIDAYVSEEDMKPVYQKLKEKTDAVYKL